jgi:hypothetical protein
MFLMVVFAFALFSTQVNDKIRVSFKEIDISEEDIFAYVESEWIPVESLSHDGCGIYVKPRYQTRNDLFRWLCNCGKYNFASDKICQHCGKDRYKYEE